MQTITIKTYSFEELKPEAQQKAIEDNREINADYYWDQVTLWEKQDELKALGYNDAKILYSGFWSQGDGACFESQIDIQAWLKAHGKKNYNKYRALYIESEGNLSICLKHSGHYYHSLMTSVDYDGAIYMSDKAQTQLDEVVKMIEKEREQLGDEIYKALEHEYESRTTDEAVRETLIENNYQFLVDGSTQYRV